MIFIGYEISFVYLTSNRIQNFVSYLSAYTTNDIVFYVNVYCLNFSFQKKKRRSVYIFLLLLEYLKKIRKNEITMGLKYMNESNVYKWVEIDK